MTKLEEERKEDIKYISEYYFITGDMPWRIVDRDAIYEWIERYQDYSGKMFKSRSKYNPPRIPLKQRFEYAK